MQNGKCKIIIEKLRLLDLDSFWSVFSRVLKEDFPGYSQAVINYFLNRMYTKANFDYWLQTGDKTVLVVKKENQIVGFAVWDKPYGGVCFLRWLGVLSQMRSQGIGRDLIKGWTEFARNYGCHKIEVASQPEAREFYEKAGLKLEGKRKNSYFGIDQYVFGLVLDEPQDEAMVRV